MSVWYMVLHGSSYVLYVNTQGIPWEDLHPPRTRQEYRELRLHSYPNYQNLSHVCEMHRDDIQRAALQPETVCGCGVG